MKNDKAINSMVHRIPRGVVGYAPGVFDMFHVGHVNILRRARLACDYLIAGVVADDVALAQKGRLPVVPEDERLEIVSHVRFVDQAILAVTTDKVKIWEQIGFDVIIKGDDWQGTPQGEALEAKFAELGVSIVYVPYTAHVSTTELRTLTKRP